MMKKIIIGLVAGVLLLLAFFAYNGAFQKVEVVRGKEGPYRLMGINHLGAYQNIGDVFEKLGEGCKKLGWKDSTAKEMTATDRLMFGVYFDNPQTKAEDSLRSFAGVQIFSTEDSLAFVKLFPDARYYEIKASEAIIVDQVTKNMPSMIIATMRAYPAFHEYLTQHAKEIPADKIGEAFEIYYPGRTRFVMSWHD